MGLSTTPPAAASRPAPARRRTGIIVLLVMLLGVFLLYSFGVDTMYQWQQGTYNKRLSISICTIPWANLAISLHRCDMR